MSKISTNLKTNINTDLANSPTCLKQLLADSGLYLSIIFKLLQL